MFFSLCYKGLLLTCRWVELEACMPLVAWVVVEGACTWAFGACIEEPLVGVACIEAWACIGAWVEEVVSWVEVACKRASWVEVACKKV